MSYGIIGITPTSYKIIQNAQQYKELHVYDKKSRPLQSYMNIKTYQSVADVCVNMRGPKTIATFNDNHTDSKRTIDQLVEWCDKEDTIINMSNEHHTMSKSYEEMCRTKGIHYLSADISDNMTLVGGNRTIADAHELFFRMFSTNIIHTGDEPGSAHFNKMIHESMECILFQAYADLYGYCNQDRTFIYALTEAKSLDINGSILHTAIDRIRTSYKYDDVACVNEKAMWACVHAAEHDIPAPLLSMSVNARLISRHVKSVDTHQVFNKFCDRAVALQTLRFVYAMVYYESIQLCPRIIDCISESTLDCLMYTSGDILGVLEDTSKYARTFMIHCIHAGVPCPAVQAAVCQYDYWKQTKTSMNFIASLKI